MKLNLEKFYIVYRGRTGSELPDIFDGRPESIGGLKLQFLGGLEPHDIVAIYTTKTEASKAAEAEMKRIISTKHRDLTFSAAQDFIHQEHDTEVLRGVWSLITDELDMSEEDLDLSQKVQYDVDGAHIDEIHELAIEQAFSIGRLLLKRKRIDSKSIDTVIAIINGFILAISSGETLE